jgi:hypothetical protein
MSEKPCFVYVIYIASTPEKVFRALTSAEMSKQYWSGNYVESDWKVGFRTTAAKFREALIKPEFTKQYRAGTWQESEWKAGTPWA